MKNVTVTLDDDAARWARLEAARREVSVSRLVQDLLREQMRDQATYGAAMRRYLSRPAQPIKRGGAYPARDEVHDRAGPR